jgi:hypothetical protein
MAGVKGRSGRKSMRDEFYIGNLTHITNKWLVENWESFSNEQKFRLAKEMALKTMPIKQDINSDQNIHIDEAHKDEIAKIARESLHNALNQN